MKSMFDEAQNAELVRRIRELQADSQGQWGKMNVTQMLAHCQQPLLVAMGDMQLKRGLIGILFGRFAKKMIANQEPFKQGLPTDKKFLVSDPREFSREQTGLISLAEKFGQGGPDGVTRKPHPFFGPLSVEEWDSLMWKHLNHHLGQFGV